MLTRMDSLKDKLECEETQAEVLKRTKKTKEKKVVEKKEKKSKKSKK